jgi:hypothetical protein
MNVRRSGNCRRGEQANQDEDIGDSQNQLNDGASYTHPKGRAVDSSSVFIRRASTIATSANSNERKSSQSPFNRHYRSLSALINSQYRKKNVEASKQVLETYHDSFLFGKVPASVKVRAALRGGMIGHVWHFVRTF